MYFTLCSWNWRRLFNIYIFSYLMIFMEGFLLIALVKHVSSNKIKMHKMEYPWHWHFRSNFFFFLLLPLGVNKIKQTIFPDWFRYFKTNCFILQYSGKDEIKTNFILQRNWVQRTSVLFIKTERTVQSLCYPRETRDLGNESILGWGLKVYIIWWH